MTPSETELHRVWPTPSPVISQGIDHLLVNVSSKYVCSALGRNSEGMLWLLEQESRLQDQCQEQGQSPSSLETSLRTISRRSVVL